MPWQDGPDTPDGVRARLRPGEEADADYRQRVASLTGCRVVRAYPAWNSYSYGQGQSTAGKVLTWASEAELHYLTVLSHDEIDTRRRKQPALAACRMFR
jgi:hypothetical protein